MWLKWRRLSHDMWFGFLRYIVLPCEWGMILIMPMQDRTKTLTHARINIQALWIKTTEEEKKMRNIRFHTFDFAKWAAFHNVEIFNQIIHGFLPQIQISSFIITNYLFIDFGDYSFLFHPKIASIHMKCLLFQQVLWNNTQKHAQNISKFSSTWTVVI